MAGASMKDIKLRIKSVESTMQITKAMELVASSKLRKAKERQERCRPYFTELRDALNRIEASTSDFSSPYQIKRPVEKQCLIVIAGDRGLAGGYNSNVFKQYERFIAENPVETVVIPIGKRSLEYFVRRGIQVLTESFSEAASIHVADCFEMADLITKGYLNGEYDRVGIIYTKFVSLLTQTTDALHLLPLALEETEKAEKAAAAEHGIQPLVIYEPDPNTVYDSIVPNYIAGMIYGAMCESVASELGARRTAMDAANKNAAEMIDDLSLKYNRARQGAITQEITEIVAGAEH
ncbi:MAG: ATP synthase F1 subunit gamma [Clostridia bacterium]|nr:ATP synthase F1 subunit gamma [Clostridia bacterium]